MRKPNFSSMITISAEPMSAPRIASWTRDRSLWVRRAAAVGLIASVRTGAALDIAYRVARDLHPDREDLIQKAVGWLLREAGKADARRLEQYLRDNGPAIPRTTVRYAIERFPTSTRRRLLRETSPAAAGRSTKASRTRRTKRTL